MKHFHPLTLMTILSLGIGLIWWSAQESPTPIILPASAESSAFSDTKGTWAESSISRWSKLGLINGYRDGSFRPQNSISSIECYAIAFRAFNHITNPTDGSDWSVPYLNFYTSEGFDTKALKPIVTQKDEPITREKALYVLLRAKWVNFTKVEELKFSRSFTGTLFPDVKRTDSYAKYILYAKERGIVNGQSDGKFGFGRPITRAELTVIALRLMDFKIIDGTCGEANDKKEGFSVAPTAWLCDAGLSGPITETASGWSWSCNVTNGGKNASCQAKRGKLSPEGGTTGPMNGLLWEDFQSFTQRNAH